MFTSLRLERFKSFKDAELKLGPFTVLIGANASGKSNVRDAFRFLHGIGRGYSLAEIIGEKYGEGGERVWTGIRGGIPEIAYSGSRSFALTISLDRSAQEALSYQIEIGIDRKRVIPMVAFERLRNKQSGDEFVGKATKGELELHYLSSEGLDQKLRDLPGNRPFLYRHGDPTGIAPPIKLRSINMLKIFQESIYTSDILPSMRFFDWDLDAIRQPAPAGQDVLSDNGRNLSSVLQAICREGQGKRALLSWIAELTPMDAVDFEFPTDPTGKVLATLVEKNGRRITLASASDGTLRFLAFLAAFLGPHPSRFYFFEELENGIHPTRLGLLLDLIENQVKNKGIQVVATTHSPQLLGHLSEESLKSAHLVYRLPDEPDARIIRVLDMPHAGDVITMNRLAHLLATGWFESTAYFMQPDPDDEKVVPPSGSPPEDQGGEMRVIVIPEGVQYDHLILRPIFSAMFRHLGKRNAKIDIHSPEVRGFDAVRQIDYILAIIADFPTADLFVLCVDRDGEPHRREALNDLENKISKVLPAPRLFLAEHAWQEVEVWALAGIDWRLKPKWTWDAIRNERDSKEVFFEPIARDRNLFDLPGQGRKELGLEAARNYAKVRQNCDEVRELEGRIREWIAATAQR